MAPHTTMGVGGPARLFVEVNAPEALAAVLGFLREAGVAWMMLGGGSNTLFDDGGYAGAVVHLGREFRTVEEVAGEESVIRAGAGATLGAILSFARRRDWTGLEFCVGIPGTLGGALAGNAGAGGLDVCSLADSVEVLTEEGADSGAIEILRRGEFEFSYRASFLRDRVIVAATLRLAPGEPEQIKARTDEHLSKRWEQPVGERTSGCMFKNPPDDFAGRVIDRCGLKGLAVGGVRVSETHANFMVNSGAATAAEVRSLMDEVRRRVAQETGIELESEVRWVGSPPA